MRVEISLSVSPKTIRDAIAAISLLRAMVLETLSLHKLKSEGEPH